MNIDAAEENFISRYVVTARPVSPVPQADVFNFPKTDLVLVTGDAPKVAKVLINRLKAENIRVRQVVWSRCNGKNGGILMGGVSEEAADAFYRGIRNENERVGAVINFAGFADSNGAGSPEPNDAAGFFLLLKTFATDIQDSVRRGGGMVVNILPLGGSFGLDRPPSEFQSEAAGAWGVAKTAALEWPGVKVRCIDIDADMDEDIGAEMVFREFRAEGDARETGIGAENRCSPALISRPVSSAFPELDTDSVLLLIGGASGITFEIAREMARRYNSIMILVGRTSIKENESQETVDLIDSAALRSYFIWNRQPEDRNTTPAIIDERINNILKRRRIVEHIGDLKTLGARVSYHDMDVRDEGVLAGFIDDIYRRYGKIDGVVHGAGIIEDRRIQDKSLASFRAVYDAKVIPARVLARKLNPDLLKFMVFFSSVAARFGNVGQCDYSAANEVLNKMALHLSACWPKTCVKSIGWGPWETGMVKDGLKKMYMEKGIGLIPVQAGTGFFLNELGGCTSDEVEVLATAVNPEMLEKGLGRAT